MIPYLRQMKISELLYTQEIISINEMQLILPNISISTIRRDIKVLVQKGIAIELQGGGVRLKDSAYDAPVDIKEHMFNIEKKTIAEYAAGLVYDGETVYIDSGTTLTYMFPLLLKKVITLVTTNTDLYKFTENYLPDIRIIYIGGEFNYNLRSIAGPITNKQLDMLHFDKAFLGASGFHESAGITTPDFQEMVKKQIIKQNSKQSYFLLDASKNSQIYLSRICTIDESTIITNSFETTLNNCARYFIV